MDSRAPKREFIMILGGWPLKFVFAMAERRIFAVEVRRSGGVSGDRGEKGFSDTRRWLMVVRMAEGGSGVERAVWTSWREVGVPACMRLAFVSWSWDRSYVRKKKKKSFEF